MSMASRTLSNMNRSLQGLVKPDKHYRFYNPDYEAVRSRLALIVGLTAILLPLAIIASSWLGLSLWRDTLSHYYHARFLGGFFVLSIAMVGACMIVYVGESFIETFVATIAGGASLGVAYFPTRSSGLQLENGQIVNARIFAPLTEVPNEGPVTIGEGGLNVETVFLHSSLSGIFHYASAALLFALLAYYSLFIFTRVTDKQDEGSIRSRTNKWWRNVFYRATGISILVCMAAIGVQGMFELHDAWWRDQNMTLRLEAFMMIVFGIAWLIKAKPFGMLADEQ